MRPRNHGNYSVNLVNTSGPHEHEPILESIPPVGPLGVAIRQGRRAKKGHAGARGQAAGGFTTATARSMLPCRELTSTKSSWSRGHRAGPQHTYRVKGLIVIRRIERDRRSSGKCRRLSQIQALIA